MQSGDLVTARKGRTDGGYYFVVAVKDGFGYIADGKTRKAGSPKKKNIKHLSETGLSSEAVRERLANGQNAVDALIRAELSRLKLMLQ